LACACPGESYLLRIYGKPVVRYRFCFSDGSAADLYDEIAAGQLISGGMVAEARFFFYAEDCYDGVARLYDAPYDLLMIFRNIQKTGVRIGGYMGNELRISIRPGIARYVVAAKTEFSIEPQEYEKHAARRLQALESVCVPADKEDIKRRVSLNVPVSLPPVPARYSLAGKEYRCTSDPESFLVAFVAEVALSSETELAESASRIIVELRNSGVDVRRKIDGIVAEIRG
jgi:hypothetical protein